VTATPPGDLPPGAGREPAREAAESAWEPLLGKTSSAAGTGPLLLAGLWPGGSGPAVALTFQRLLALIFLIAWISLAAQIRLLIGPRGLLPLGSFLESAGPLPILGYPSLLRWPALAGNGVLLTGTIIGVLLALSALAGLRPRLCFALSTLLYLTYAAACRTFLSFQWDNLLLECGLLASFLPTTRPAPLVHLLFRLLAVKLYFESGLAKWQSPLGDWQDGSAMTFYYETAPLPTTLAWFAHHLPTWWHHLESRATLVLELVLPFGIFGPRRARLALAAVFTGFQIINAATANYGFFCYLAVALHLFLLDDGDVAPLARRWLRPDVAPSSSRFRGAAFAGAGLWLLLSLLNGFVHFSEGGAWLATLEPLREMIEPLRLVNTYHLFASITRTRIEAQFEVETAGQWRPVPLWHKPGDPRRRPDFVAPHQPRVDFQLWFYGLSFQRQPQYVLMLVDRLCRDPAAVAPLFRDPPPPAEAVRIAYYQYRFTTPAERRATGAWWNRTLVDTTQPVPCDR
jgi:hypothetical protein